MKTFSPDKDDQQPSAPWATSTKLARMMGVVVIIEAIAIVALVVVIAFMVPLKEKIPIFYEFKEPGQNFVRIDKAGKDLTTNGQLIRMFLRRYVMDRETVDKQTETSIRYPRVFAMSSNAVATNFKKVYGNPETGLFFKKGFKRSVHIQRDSYLDTGLHQIEFETVDTLEGKPGQAHNQMVKKTEWVSIITYDFLEQDVNFEDSLLNPLGLGIVEYTITKRRK